ncbi:MAG: YjbE family putative metal transport protein [Chloroflexi bacterium]|nr:YjbE family putative metal transport protein [Chloroflexota bacterium]MBV9545142.1 YjbE family putative metal transport protein [Chloroflexota bacterium]
MPPLSAETISRALQIILIDLLLSGDNAVVIGIAAHPLPRRQRQMAIVFGGGAAIVLRILLTGGAALLLELPLVRLVGGLLLLWIAFKLVGQEKATHEGVKAATSLGGAIATILAADLIMSLDNVLGVAAVSSGDFWLLMFGLVVSMAIVLLGGSIFADWIDRMRWLAYLGAAVIAWTGIDMLQDETALAMQLATPVRLTLDAVITIGVVALAYQVHRRSLATR